MENKYRLLSQNLCSGNGTEEWQKTANRAKVLIPKVVDYRPDIFCIQEGTPEWMKLLEEGLSEAYDFEFVYRDGHEKSETNAIFFKKDRFELLETKTFWLSDTPDKMSASWFTACVRICTYVLIKDKTTGKELAVFNTHLDHKSPLARYNGAKLIVKKIQELGYGKHVILTGDMNSKEKFSLAYKVFVDSGLLDAKFNSRYSMTGKTFNGYGNFAAKINNLPIDFVFVKKDEEVTINNYKIIKDKSSDGHYLSDHFGLLVDVEY